MKRIRTRLAALPSTGSAHARSLASALALLAAAPLAAEAQSANEAGWPAWRGPDGSGYSATAKPPVTWSEEENVRWKVALDGSGDASPIVFGDRIFVLSARPVGDPVASDEEPGADRDEEGDRRGGGMRNTAPTREQEFLVTAYAREDGSVVWQDVARKALPHEGTHGDSTWASASATTDGERLVANFGSNGLYVYSLDGEKLWETDLGDMTTRNGFGEGASPALHDGVLVVPWDHEGPSFVVALDAATGDELWRHERDEVTSWATPAIAYVAERAQAIVNGTSRIRGYDLATGDVVWECGGMTTNAIPSPIVRDGIAYVTSGFRGSCFVAIDLASAKGDVTGKEAVLWQLERDTPYVPSPVLVDHTLYFLKGNSGIVTAIDRATGDVRFGPQRLDAVANVYASPVAADGRVYFVGRDGTTAVLKHGPTFEVLAVNVLDDAFDASPALVDDDLYLRGASHLYCLANASE